MIVEIALGIALFFVGVTVLGIAIRLLIEFWWVPVIIGVVIGLGYAVNDEIRVHRERAQYEAVLATARAHNEAVLAKKARDDAEIRAWHETIYKTLRDNPTLQIAPPPSVYGQPTIGEPLGTTAR